MPKKGGGRLSKKRASKKMNSEDEFFLLNEHLHNIEKRINSVHRWVIFQRVVFWIKVLILAVAVVAGVSVYNTYFDDFRNQFLELYSEFRSSADLFNKLSDNIR